MNEVKIDDTVLKEKIKKFNLAVKKVAKDILLSVSLKGAETASRYTPPKKDGQWSRNISAKQYKRPVYSISQLLNNDDQDNQNILKKLFKAKTTKRDLGLKIRQGYKFVVLKDSSKNKKVWFAKTQRQAKSKYGRIKYRGLLKLMYGIQFLNNGLFSTVFEKLLRNSPSLSNLNNMNELKYVQQDQYYQMATINKAASEENYKFTKKDKYRQTVKPALKKALKKFNENYFKNKKL